MPRFVILEHDWPQLHWDLMLETAEVLRTWRLAAPPGTGAVEAEPAFDHRLVYLDYEGPVSGGRGTVRRWDHGDYRIIEEDADQLRLSFEGERLRGEVILERCGERWALASGGRQPLEREAPLAQESVAEGEPGGGPGSAGQRPEDQAPDEAPPAA